MVKNTRQGTFIAIYERIANVSVRTLTCATMVFDVALRICRARIDIAWVDASTIEAGHVRCTLRVALANCGDLFVHCKCLTKY